MKKTESVLITGAAGLIGSNLCKWILINQHNIKVIALDDLSGSEIEDFVEGCDCYIRNAGDDLTDIFESNDVKMVFHAAAIAAESWSPFMRQHYYTNNIVVSANVINHCIKYNVDRLVYFSSMAVYGKQPTPFIESMSPSPCDPYGIGKFSVELDLQCAKEQHGLKYAIVRPHSVYGPGQQISDTRRNVLCIWMRQILNNELISIFGDGQQQRAFTFVDDIMFPLWKCGYDESTLYQTFNLGNDDELTLLQALETLEEVVGKKVERKYYPAIHEVKNAFSEHSKAREILGLECKTSLKEGLTKMWDWAKVQPKRELQRFDELELEVGLPEQFKK